MNIYMDSDATKKTAEEMISYLSALNDNIKSLDNILDNMKTAWSGSDATEFFNVMKEKNIPELKKLYEVLLSYSYFLQKTPNIYQILDEVFTNKKMEI